MNTTHIKSFMYVAKYNSISKAALELNYSNSTVQGHLKALEMELNTKLYERTSTGIYLTEKGFLFLDYARKILDIIDDIQTTFKLHDSIIRVSATESVNVSLINPLINKFIKKYPSVEIEYTKSTTDTAVEKISTNQCDVSLIAEPQFSSSKVHSEFLCKMPLSFVTSPRHICFKVGLLNSREHNILLCTMALPVVTGILKNVGLCFSEFFSAEKNIGDLQTIKELAYEGHVITLLPTGLIKDDLSANRLKVIPELDRDLSTNVYILTPLEATSKKELIDGFISLLRAILPESRQKLPR